MLKKVLSVMLAAAIVSQGAARADEAAAPHVSVVPDRAALAVHIDALEEGDHVAVATDEGVVSGEVVDKDADDLVIDQPLIQGGAERIAIPRREIQGVRYQPSTAHQARVPVKALVTVAVVVGIVIGIAAMVGRGLGGP
jgi:hypothetical protein